jgi:hypothetical protein
MDYNVDFLVEGKKVFDWLVDSEMAEVDPYDANGIGLCNPCGP